MRCRECRSENVHPALIDDGTRTYLSQHGTVECGDCGCVSSDWVLLAIEQREEER